MPDTQALGRIVDQLRRMHEGDAWHGPSLREALEGVTAAMAVARPISAGHTIYELTHHLAAWANEVTRRLDGRSPRMPDEGDFPPAVEALSDAEWEAAQARLDTAHTVLVEAILAFDPGRLHEVVTAKRDTPIGVGVTYYAMLHGVVQHDAYHAGQIALLRKALA